MTTSESSVRNPRERGIAVDSVLALLAPVASRAQNAGDTQARVAIENFGQISDSYW